jgi:thiol-disulfide isomerase/thioredoxin
MKKRLPLFIIMFLFTFYLIGQGYIFSPNPNASPAAEKQKLYSLYESKLKKTSFVTMDGKKVRLNKKMPKVVILNFWASWCTPCLEEFPSLVKLQRKYKENKNILILTVNTDDSEILKKVKQIVERYKLNFPIVLDKNGKLVEKFSIAAIPVSIIYKDGKVYEVSNMAKDFYSGEFLELLASWKI